MGPMWSNLKCGLLLKIKAWKLNCTFSKPSWDEFGDLPILEHNIWKAQNIIKEQLPNFRFLLKGAF